MSGLVGPGQIHVGKTVAFVAGRLQSALKPGNGLINFALLQQVGPDIVVGISKGWIGLNRLVAFRDRVVEATHEAVSPSQKGVSLRSRVALNGLLVELNGFVELLAHLLLIGFVKQPAGFLQAIVAVHG